MERMCSQEIQLTISKTRIFLEVVEEERESGARGQGIRVEGLVRLDPLKKVMSGLFLAQDHEAGIPHSEVVEAPWDEEVVGEEDGPIATLRLTPLRGLALGIFPI